MAQSLQASYSPLNYHIASYFNRKIILRTQIRLPKVQPGIKSVCGRELGLCERVRFRVLRADSDPTNVWVSLFPQKQKEPCVQIQHTDKRHYSLQWSVNEHMIDGDYCTGQDSRWNVKCKKEIIWSCNDNPTATSEILSSNWPVASCAAVLHSHVSEIHYDLKNEGGSRYTYT